MPAFHRNRTRPKDDDIGAAPFMNLIVVLIPLLLLAAEFSKISLIELRMPNEAKQGTDETTKDEIGAMHERPRQNLTILITDSTVILTARGDFLHSIRYRDYSVDAGPQGRSFAPGLSGSSSRPVKGRGPDNRSTRETVPIVVDENGSPAECLYTAAGEMVAGPGLVTLAQVRPGDTVWTVGGPAGLSVVSGPAGYSLRHLSLYDALAAALLKARAAAAGAPDTSSVILASEQGVRYQKIVGIMDTAREAGFPEISIARLRGQRG
jgi:biopolymer transport protein ExbD